jgi:hypothetical protein
MATILFRKENGVIDLSRIEKQLYSAFSLLKNGEYTLSITKKINKRTPDQNRLMWLWFSCIGHNVGMHHIKVKEAICAHLSTEEVEIEGKRYKVPISTSKLNKEQFTSFLEQVKMWAHETLGLDLPEPSDLIFEEFEKEYGKYLT